MKPENIFLLDNRIERIELTDFGLRSVKEYIAKITPEFKAYWMSLERDDSFTCHIPETESEKQWDIVSMGKLLIFVLVGESCFARLDFKKNIENQNVDLHLDPTGEKLMSMGWSICQDGCNSMDLLIEEVGKIHGQFNKKNQFGDLNLDGLY